MCALSVSSLPSQQLLYFSARVSYTFNALWQYCVITFCVSRRRRKCIEVTRVCLCVCLCVSLSAAACLHYCTDPDVTWGSGRGRPLVVHYWADLQSAHGLRWYGNITRTRNVSECMLVLVLCLVHDCYYQCIPCQKYHGTPYEKYRGFLGVG